MKRYTTHTRNYKDQANCKNFGKQFNSMFDSMGKMFEGMGSLFDSYSDCSITEDDNKTIIKKGDKTIIINENGSVTVNGKRMVEICDSYNTTASNAPIEKTVAPIEKTVENRVFDLETKIINLYWYIGLSFVMSCSLAILISSLICK